ncbi:MAG: hypothetical protein PHZ07_02250 [Patescibacteria group bacterium]|nr:hypothetical protein [Patescibacteria group bacterium]MDD4304511.1 hypothetical protein [Patescibacteria group bacterium]MDD4694871.1 hypothetical protein [Patescibacteria group bacterium]
MKLGIIAEDVDNILHQTIGLIRRTGINIEVLNPELSNQEMLDCGFDCCFIKSSSYKAIDCARTLQNRGVYILNDLNIIDSLRDKSYVYQQLVTNGLKIPDYNLVNSLDCMTKNIKDYPLVIKPVFGSRNNNVITIKSIEDIPSTIDWPVIAQKYIPFDIEYKGYRIGDSIFLSPESSIQYENQSQIEKNKLFPLITQCGNILGLDLYSIDILFYQNQWYVIDLNISGSFNSMLDSANLIAKYIINKIPQKIYQK